MFDKKNTMILTVVAVATLIVAVIGASFAYFSISVGGTASTTASVTTANPGNITIDGAQKTLTLNVSAADMSLANAGHLYYATADGSARKDNSDNSITIATAKLNNGEANVTYTCDYTIEVKSTTQLTNVRSGDMFIKFTGDGFTGDNGTIDLSTLTQSGASGYIKNVNSNFTLAGPSASKELKASLWLVNKTGDATNNQNYLAGQTISVTITVTGKTCQINATK